MIHKNINIKLIVIDIDGVLTNNNVIIDTRNNEYKILNYRDIDKINLSIKKGINFALLTGEDTVLVDTIANRLGIYNVVKGAKNKEEGLEKISRSIMVPLENICYIGDADRDANTLKLCGLGVVPRDATDKAKECASIILNTNGGDGVVHEAIEYLIRNDYIEWN